MNTNTPAPAGVVSSTELGLLPIGPHDHPEPRTMLWSALELAAIKEYAARCMAAERARLLSLAEREAVLLDGEGMGPEANGVKAFIARATQPNTADEPPP